MRFNPSVYPKQYAREVTPRRMKCAERAVRRQLDSVALFPDLLTVDGIGSRSFHHTAEERMRDTCDGDQERATDYRNDRARMWREGRRLLDSLPESTRRGIRRYWNVCRMPADPAYFLTVVHNQWGWSRLRLLRQLQLVGEGRLPRSLFANAQRQREAATAPGAKNVKRLREPLKT